MSPQAIQALLPPQQLGPQLKTADSVAAVLGRYPNAFKVSGGTVSLLFMVCS